MIASFYCTYIFLSFYFRGNQAYKNGDLSKAEDCYTQGVNCVSKSETSVSFLRALMLCYSNRAATRMSLGRMRDALGDCKMAAAIDPNFLRVQVRAAK
jgi:DnaJ family protein C protein 7